MDAGRDRIDERSNDPYRTPAELSVGQAKRSSFDLYKIAAFLWCVLASKVVMAGYFLRPVFEDFGIELPLLTQFLLHPMASVFFFAIAVSVIVSGLTLDSAAKRRRLGRIALVLWLAAILVGFLAFVLPLIWIMQSLS